MKIEFEYDHVATAILKRTQNIYDEYCKLLKPVHEARNRGCTCSSDVDDDYKYDPGKVRLEREMVKIKSVYIPIRAVITKEDGEKITRIIRY